MLDKFPMDQIGAYINENYQIWLKYADTVKTAMKKWTDTLEKHMHHFQCQQSEFKCKKCPI